MALTVVIADDEAAVRAALVDLLNEHPALDVVGVAVDAEAAVRLVSELHPGVAVIDVRIPRGGGLEAIAGIREVSPETRIVAYSAADDRAQVSQILTAGADRYVVKGASAYHLVDAILETAESGPRPH
ncbi:MAG TPA: response regulator transcription factor [Candidatus Dormibacteraeota bacterium]